MKLVVYADGASRGNPGPASIGASIQDVDGIFITRIGKDVHVVPTSGSQDTIGIHQGP